MSVNIDAKRSLAEWQQSLAQLWADGIPLATAMKVEIRRLDAAGLELAAPLAPNRNHMGSAFGGSLQGLAMLAGWSVTLVAAGTPGASHVVVRDARMRFKRPVTGELRARAAMPSPTAVADFRAALAAHGRAPLAVAVEIVSEAGSVAARFEGEFVAFAAPAPD
jgi:thioesterase domain-containing protein